MTGVLASSGVSLWPGLTLWYSKKSLGFFSSAGQTAWCGFCLWLCGSQSVFPARLALPTALWANDLRLWTPSPRGDSLNTVTD